MIRKKKKQKHKKKKKKRKVIAAFIESLRDANKYNIDIRAGKSSFLGFKFLGLKNIWKSPKFRIFKKFSQLFVKKTASLSCFSH